MTELRAALAAKLGALHGVGQADSAFQVGPGYWVNGKEIAHFEGSNGIDIRLTRAEIRLRRTAFQADERVALRRSGADWISVRFDNTQDVEFVTELVEVAERAHRAPAGTLAKPPPVGRDLERRRRFH